MVLPTPQWRVTGPGSTTDEGLHETVARLARAMPTAVALVEGEGTVTYGRLDQTADAFAAQLVAEGIGPGQLVPVLLPRSAELVGVLLAVLKTGAAYALLDPAWPADRLREVIDELDAHLVIGPPDAKEICARPVWSPAVPVALPYRFQPVAVRGADPCTVFFTSGTTGKPKGVVSPHRATARLFQANSFAHFNTGTTIPLAAPTPWDAFSLELWSVLLNGGTALITDEPFLSVQAIRDGLVRHGLNTVWLTTSLFTMIVDEDLAAFDGLTQVMIGGERLSVPHVARFLRRHPDIKLINGYGPVESTIFATTHLITEADCAHPGGIPLGRPAPGTEVYVLDGARPSRPGEIGEICLAGEGLALRYLGDAKDDPAFTEVRLDGQSKRIYRTGDLGMWDSEGVLHFRGRADRQIKIRGHRIEPAEIERQVENLIASVRSCRVLARTDEDGIAADLVAYCVPEQRGDSLHGVTEELTARLPAYQRPAAVLSVDSYPMTDRGKLDEAALLALAESGWRRGIAPDDIPEDATVQLIADTFRTVLNHGPIPLDTSFFDLGGTSLAAGRVCTRLSTALGDPVPVSRLYQNHTVRDLAMWLRLRETNQPHASANHSANTASLADGVPLTPMQVTYLARQLADPTDRTGNCMLVWLLDGNLDQAGLESAISAVHHRHEALRAVYSLDPAPAAHVLDVEPPPLEVLDSSESREAAEQTLRSVLAEPLLPQDGDNWRTILVPVRGEQAALFGCAVHHIAFDGWSESVLARELGEAYRASRDTQEHPNPPSLALAEIHSRHAVMRTSAELADDAAQLADELDGTPSLRWPLSPSGTATEQPGSIEVMLNPAVIAAVDELADRAGVSRFVVLLAHTASALSEVTGQDDFAVGVPVAQRAGSGLDGVIGCHIAMICLRLRFAALTSGTDAVTETARVVQRGLATQDVPLSEVLRSVDTSSTDRPPLFQTLFAYQDSPPPELTLDGLRTVFLRQPYSDLPLEFHTEFWEEPGGGVRLAVGFLPNVVAEATAKEFVECFLNRLPNSSQES